MSRPWGPAWRPLAAAAAGAMPRAGGAARRSAVAEDASGRLHVGVEMRILEPPAASLCAEHAAVAAMVAAGGVTLVRLLVAGPAGRAASPPCGRCLQVMAEFGRKVEIRWGTVEAEEGRSMLARLLPFAFRDFVREPKEDPSCRQR